MNYEQSCQVIGLLDSNDTNLRNLAASVGQDPFDFYQGADLTGLCLDNQDLRGMNFAGADLRFTTTANIEYDLGAFNGSVLDTSQAGLQDPFQFYADDVMSHDTNQILIHCRFRPEMLDLVINDLMRNVTTFAKEAGVSTNALRKARAGRVVAIETAQGILAACKRISDNLFLPIAKSSAETILRQPSIEFLSGGINMPFKHISRSRYQRLYEMRHEIVCIRRKIYPKNIASEWRDTAESLEAMLDYYRDKQEELETVV